MKMFPRSFNSTALHNHAVERLEEIQQRAMLVEAQRIHDAMCVAVIAGDDGDYWMWRPREATLPLTQQSVETLLAELCDSFRVEELVADHTWRWIRSPDELQHRPAKGLRIKLR